jgi:hypothetical protein
VGNLRACVVSYRDPRGVTHAVEVQAESLFEAAVRALKLLRSNEWSERPGEAMTLEIEIPETSARHTVDVQQVARWLNGASASPMESIRKVHLRKWLLSK